MGSQDNLGRRIEERQLLRDAELFGKVCALGMEHGFPDFSDLGRQDGAMQGLIWCWVYHVIGDARSADLVKALQEKDRDARAAILRGWRVRGEDGKAPLPSCYFRVPSMSAWQDVTAAWEQSPIVEEVLRRLSCHWRNVELWGCGPRDA